MKKMSVIIIAILLFVLLQITSAASSEYENFEGSVIGASPPGFSVVDKANTTGGRILIAGGSVNKYVNMKIIVPQGATTSDSYFNTKQLSADSKIKISAKINPSNLQNGEFAIILRDSTPLFINLIQLKGTTFTAFPELKKSTYDRACLASEWYLIVIDIDFKSQRFEVEFNGEKVASEPFTEKQKSFLYNNFTIRFDHKVTSSAIGTVSEVNVDNIFISSDFMNDSKLFISVPVIYDNFDGVEYETDGFSPGNMGFKNKIANLSNDMRILKIFVCRYQLGKLIGISEKSVEVGAGEEADLRHEFWVEEKTDLMKIFCMDEQLSPLTTHTIIGKRNIDIPFTYEVTRMLKQKNANKSHPRILADKARFDLINQTAKINSDVSSWKAALTSQANNILTQTPLGYTKADGLRLSADNASKIVSLAFAYKMTNDKKYADKVMEYVNVTAAYPDWNAANHFLDTSGLAVGFAVAFDWCYDYLSDPQKTLIKETLKNYALIPANNAYDTKAWWTAGTNNWCVVCNGGMTMAALAIGDEEGYEELCGTIVAKAVKSMRNALPLFAPDGAWFEGPGYWGYTVEYLANYVTTLKTALGTDFGTMDFEGVRITGYFPVYMTGATNKTFNLHDAGESTIDTPEIGWLGNETNDIHLSKYRYYQLKKLNYTCRVKDLLWLDFNVLSQSLEVNLPTDKMFRESEVASLRNNFFGANSVFAALHGGENNIPHGSLDVGEFIYEALGQRWAIDLGGDNYNLQGYFDNAKYRWWYYRNRAEGHNVVILNPDENILCDQDLDAFSRTTQFASGENMSYAVIDSGSAYKKYVNSGQRGLYLDKQTGGIVIQDEMLFKPGRTNDMYWFMHTKATVNLSSDKKSAVLSQGGKSVWVGIISGGNTSLMVQDALPRVGSPNPNQLTGNINNTPPNPKTQNTNSGIRKLVINDVAASGNYMLSVAIIPLSSGQSAPDNIPAMTPIANWSSLKGK